MLTRVWIALLLLAMAGVAFLAGLIAPPTWRQHAQAALEPVQRVVSAAVAAAAAAPASGASGASGAAWASARSASGASAASATVLSREQLWAPAPGASYALLAGQFPAEASANSLANNLRQRGVDVNVLPVQDSDAITFWVVAVGRYASSAEAYAESQAVASRLDLSPPLAAVALPVAASGSDR